MNQATLIVTILLALVAVLHLLRLVFNVSVVIGTVVIPLWASAVGFVVAGGLAVILWRQNRS